ncbi:CRISPR-associated endonuclease Cas1 [Ignicoccus hospitalis]|uniref:CRISPR-associated endonuclease Cas1 n=1 Tax=Ignicoccus hospitalis (strain KIN4/I / DSM 18386 / JCM 14125) TaxID=453591 RepID=A8ABE8_IGNH4|nr:CRISPR-associated endonuclease Cas1 [Ignicoccus hospitalis]ABU82250.1 CRISPR-associated protein Cas1 [Ignicoccus hospitalis KIN4/I]HIH90831.1 CRISPR-associated endonuclease Cas1 [Desulfurococcaceae archaeon]
MILVVRGHAFVGRKGYMITVRYKKDGKEVTEAFPALDIEMAVFVGKGITVSTAALQLLEEQNVPTLFHGVDWSFVTINPVKVGWSRARKNQYSMGETELGVKVAKEFIFGKLEGMSNVAKNLSYKGKKPTPNSDYWRSEGRGELASCKNLDCVKKLEAEWSSKLWKDIVQFVPGMRSRVPRGNDPPNRTLDYLYALLYSVCNHALVGAGLDPYAGLIHRERAGKLSFVYDFSEMFKPMAIYVMATAIRTYKIELEGDFLNKESLQKVTQLFYSIFESKKYSVRKWVYAKAWQLRDAIESGKEFKAFVFRP